jgi:hypothetical protein
VALSKLDANSFDLTDNYAFTGTTTGVTSTQKLFLIKNLDASSSSTLSFVDGSSSVVLDNTYKTYLFRFINMHPSAYEELGFQGSTDSGSNYNTQITSTFFQASHTEAASAGVSYLTNYDQANGTNFQRLNYSTYTDNDSSLCGELFLFNPSSTTFVKHFIARTQEHFNNGSSDSYAAGYFNTTSAIDAVQFKMESGNIDSGRIALYGIK